MIIPIKRNSRLKEIEFYKKEIKLLKVEVDFLREKVNFLENNFLEEKVL